MKKRDDKPNILVIDSEENAQYLRGDYDEAFPENRYFLHTNSPELNRARGITEDLLPEDALLGWNEASIEQIVNNHQTFDAMLVHRDYDHLVKSLVSAGYLSIVIVGEGKKVGIINDSGIKLLPCVPLFIQDFPREIRNAASSYI